MTERPIDYARMRYEQEGICFDSKLDWYLKNGWTVSTPELFAMGFFYSEDDKIVCFIEACVGPIQTLLNFSINNIDFLEFHRDFKDSRKRYDYNRFVRKI